MQDLKVGILQFDQVWQDKQANYKRVESLINPHEQIDILLLPEMFHTGFSMEINHADDWKYSEGLEFLITVAKKMSCAVYSSIMVKEHAQYFNRGVFIEENGTTHIYDKRKTFGLGGEDKFFTRGNQEKIVFYKGWKFNLQICYDLRFPELIRNRIESIGQPAYDVLLNIANWPQKRIHHWDALLKARAIENQCYVVACNRTGLDGNELLYNGQSQAYDLYGQSCFIPSEKEEFIQLSLCWSNLVEARKQLPFLKDA